MATGPTIDQHNEYERFVGGYITAFSRLEYTLTRLALQYSNLNLTRFRIFTHRDTQIGDRVSLLKKLVALASLDDESRAATADAFDQLNHLTTLRHRIVHHGGHPVAGDQILIRSKPTQISSKTMAAYDLYTIQQLRSARMDLDLVERIIAYRLDPEADPAWQQAQAVNGVRQSAWQYKPPG